MFNHHVDLVLQKKSNDELFASRYNSACRSRILSESSRARGGCNCLPWATVEWVTLLATGDSRIYTLISW